MIGLSRVSTLAATVIAVAACGPEESPTLRAVGSLAAPTQCGPTIDFEPINEYSGSLPWVQDREDAVAFVNGACTGTYIGGARDQDHLVLTAGHCVGLGDEVLVAFNLEDDPDGVEWRGSGIVVERQDEPDYALIALPEDPGAPSVALDIRPSSDLAIIQHPRGGKKVIAEGLLFEAGPVELRYEDLDTLVGSSGAGVFNVAGRIVGVHSDGDCDAEGGTNVAYTIESIVEVSPLLSIFRFDC